MRSLLVSQEKLELGIDDLFILLKLFIFLIVFIVTAIVFCFVFSNIYLG